MSWIMLSVPEVSYEEVRGLAAQLYPDLAEEDSLFDEVQAFDFLFLQIKGLLILGVCPQYSFPTNSGQFF